MIEITLDENKHNYKPGELVRGTVEWRFERNLKALEIRLIWKTTGKGDSDMGMVDSIVVEVPPGYKKMPFELRMPSGPYSFSGKLISIMWLLEVVTDPTTERVTRSLAMSPTGSEIGADDWKMPQRGGYLQQ